MDFEFESKTHLLAILDNMPFMAWYKDNKCRFIAVNQPFADSCGKTKEEIIGETDFDIWPYELAQNYTNDDYEVMRTKEKKSFEEQIDDHFGGTWFETFKSPVFDDDGNVIGTIGMSKDISKSKHFQLEIENQKIFIKSMIDSIPDLIFYKDINSTYLGCNHAFAHEFIGLTEDEIIGKNDLDFVKDVENAKFFRQKDLEVFAQGKTQINEETVQFFNGNFVCLETSKTPFYNEDGEIAGLIGIARDITNRKIFEKKLKIQSDYSKMLLQTVPSGVYSIDNQLRITSWNHMSEKITGYTSEEVMGKCVDLFNFHPCRENCELCINKLSGPDSKLTVQIKNKNGDIRYLRKNIDVLKNDLGEIIGGIECFDDITENVLVEKQLKESEKELKQKEKILSAAAFSIKELLENRDYLDAISKCFELIGTATQVSRICLFVNTYDDDGIYTSEKLKWNSGSYKSKLNNSKLENIPFENLEDFISILKNNKPFHGVTKKLEKCKIRYLLESRDSLSFIIFPIFVEKVFWGFIGLDECKYERNWTESEISTLSAFGTSIGKTIERDLIEKTLETSRQNAETANMLKSQFLANMSHEIRTPMHAILGYTSLLKDIVENDESLNYLNAIQKAGNMLMSLITDILDLSKIEAGKLELQTGYVNIRRLFDDIKEIFSLKIENKNIKIYMDIDPKIPKTVLMDEVRIRQILFNLVGNAVKFTDEGLITVSANVSNFNEKDNSLSLTFKVQDTGIGIPEDQQSSIFNPFKQKDGQNNKKYGGTGLGLSISKRLIDIMNGSLSLISKVDKGSTFIIDIPNISIGQLDNNIYKSEMINFEEQLIINNINSSINKEIKIKNIKAINPEMFEKIAKLKDGLWLDCINKNRVSDMKKFANLMLGIGSKYNHNDTMEYAKLLQSYINSFDLRNTKELLKQYPTILEIYKSSIDKE